MISEDESSSDVESEAKALPPSVAVPADAELLSKEDKNRARKHQFRFNEESEIALLKQASARAPWEAPHGRTQTAWEEVADNLRSSGLIIDGRRAKLKFESLLKTWRGTCAKEERQSGVDVVYSEREILLEDVRTQVDEWMAHGKHAAEIARKAQVKAQKDGKDIRVASMSALKRSRDETENEGGDDEIRRSSTSARRQRCSGSFEHDFAELKDSYVQRKETNLSLRERELVVQEKKVEIEEKRVEMEMKDRAASRDVQSSTMLAMVSLMKSLTEKLEK
jgi:hypothetical protein